LALFLKRFLERHVAGQIFRIFLESRASEHGARMTAMDGATSNAGEVIKALTLQYNRARQASITKELIEIVSGAEAL
jgi:F-type H+-transporting ATPase subunit gamma